MDGCKAHSLDIFLLVAYVLLFAYISGRIANNDLNLIRSQSAPQKARTRGKKELFNKTTSRIYTRVAPQGAVRIEIAKYNFWNTTEPIWTVTTADTENSGLSCLVDVKENDTGSYTYFQRSHNVSSTQERKTVEFKGYVSPGNKFDRTAMLLYYTNNTLYAKEDLLYESPDSSCGVIKFFHHPEVIRLDLRVKNSSIETGRHTICFQYFLQAVKYYQSKPPYPDIKNRTLYNSSCQAILKSLKSGC
nr:uncharacterized protein LOC126534351 isoform X1 [Dermacentor andersoni]